MELSHQTSCKKYITEQRHWHRVDRQSRLLFYEKVSAFKLSFFKEIQTRNIILWLFNIPWQIAAVQAAREPFISSSLLVIARNKHQKVSCFNRGKTSIHNVFLNQVHSPVWFCLLDKMENLALWLVRSPVNQTPGEGSIRIKSQGR